MSTITPVRREQFVEASVEVAFAAFTEGIGTWWPLADVGVFHDGTVAFVDGSIVETSAQREQTVWGEVTEWRPPLRLAFTWHPGAAPGRASRVEVEFTAAEGRTLVTLVHSGWEVFADPQTLRDEYDRGWPGVLGHYVSTVAGTSPEVARDSGDEPSLST